MIEFITQYKEIIIVLGIIVTFFCKGILSWRHKICFEYNSKKDVAINILRDKIVQTIINIKKDEEPSKDKEKIYSQLSEKNFFSDIAQQINNISGCYKFLDICSNSAVISSWIIILSLVFYLLSLQFSWHKVIVNILICINVTSFVVCIFSITCLIIKDGKFFKLANNIIEKEQ